MQLITIDFETYSLYEPLHDKDIPAVDVHRLTPRLLTIKERGHDTVVHDLNDVELEVFEDVLMGPDTLLIGHNLYFDALILRHYFGYWPQGEHFCTMLAAGCEGTVHMGERQLTRPSLADCSAHYLGESMDKTEQVSDWSDPVLTYDQLMYAEQDVETTYALYEELNRQREGKLFPIVMGAAQCAAEMKYRGVSIDTEKRDAYLVEQRVVRDEKKEEVDAIADKALNMWNERIALSNATREERRSESGKLPPKLKLLALFTGRGNTLQAYVEYRYGHVRDWPRTASGKISCSAETFKEFARQDPIRGFRDAEANINNVEQRMGQLHPVTGKIHPDLLVAGAVTGRFVCRKPNLQNIKRSETFRRMFIASEGMALVAGDYSQIELRVPGAISEDVEMTRIYREGLDLHGMTTQHTLGREEFTDEERTNSKITNFQTIYGAGPRGIAGSTGMTERDAANFVQGFLGSFPQMHKMMRMVQSQSERSRKMRTKLGRVRTLTNAFTQGFNHLVQGTAAEIIQAALSREFLAALRSLGGWPVLTIHDEIVIEVPLGKEQLGINLVNHHMVRGWTQVLPKSDPAYLNGLVGAKSGNDLYEVH